MLEQSFGRLQTYQNPEGGFSLWGGGGYDVWLSSYVTQFLQDARREGFAPPETMLVNARDFLLRKLQEGVARLPAGNVSGRGDAADFDSLVHAGYVLSRESKAPLSTLRQLYDLRAQSRTGLHLVQLGVALQLMGDEPRGTTAIGEGLDRLLKGGSRNWWHYGSPLRDAAQAWAMLGAHKFESPARDRLIDAIAAELGRQSYYSTQEQLALFLVGREFATQRGSGDWKADLVSGGKAQALVHKGALFHELSTADVGAGVQIRNTQGTRLYAELVLSGYSAKPLPPRSEEISLSRSYFTPEGQPIGNRILKVGETVIVRIEAGSKAAIANGLVVDRVPAGLEIENRNLVQGESMASTRIGGRDPVEAMFDKRIQHVEYRDDRFVAAVRFDGETWRERDRMQLFYRAKVVTPGRFVVPPLHAEDMYRPEVFGLTGGSESITVVDPPPARK
jgi:uncharacterized protein YfaS (alpha-2-macroglobulin family)